MSFSAVIQLRDDDINLFFATRTKCKQKLSTIFKMLECVGMTLNWDVSWYGLFYAKKHVKQNTCTVKELNSLTA